MHVFSSLLLLFLLHALTGLRARLRGGDLVWRCYRVTEGLMRRLRSFWSQRRLIMWLVRAHVCVCVQVDT